MNTAAVVRISAYLFAVLVATVPAMALNDSSRAAATDWSEPLRRAEAALASGNPRAAEQAWEQAYRAAVQARAPEGLLAVGGAYLRIGEAARDRSTAVARARRIFLTALFQARERDNAAGVAAAAAAFATLGDRDVSERAFAVATALATRHRDAAARERIAVLQAEAADARRTR
jgi:hypothetical protein